MGRLDKGKAILRDVSQNKKSRTSVEDELGMDYGQCSYWAAEDDWHRENVVSDSLCKGLQEQIVKSEGEAVKDLPEGLVEKIFASMPYPYVFKVRVLSKSWLMKLSPVSSLVDDEEKRCATVFQKQIEELSYNWKRFCIFKIGDVDGSAHAYEPTTFRWSRIPSVHFPPHRAPYVILSDPSSFAAAEQIEGPLLLWSTPSEGRNELFVANLLTRTWKALPPRPFGIIPGKAILVLMNAKYQVIHLPDTPHRGFLQKFDSMVGKWTCTTFPTDLIPYPVDLESIAYVYGILYVVSINKLGPGPQSLRVRALKVHTLFLEEQFCTDMGTELQTYSTVHAVIIEFRQLFLIAFGMDYEIIVVKMDLNMPRVPVARAVATAKIGTLYGPIQRMVVSCGQWIFITDRGSTGLVNYRVLSYDVQYNKWCWEYHSSKIPGEVCECEQRMDRTYFYRIRGSFRPGLNPFLEV